MPRYLLIGALIGLTASSGCAGPRLIVRSDRGAVAEVDLSKVQPVQYDKEDLQEAVKPYTDLIAGLTRQHDGQLHLRLTSTEAFQINGAEREFVEAYLSWCQHRGEPGDCLDVQDARMPGLTADAKQAIALRMAFGSAMHEAAEAIRGINPIKVEALMLASFAVYLATLVFPEPVTKALNVLMTANLIAFVGWFGFHNIVEGYLDMRKDAADARDFGQLYEAGRKYGRSLGPSMVRLVTVLVTWGLGAAAGMSKPVTKLPGGELAAMNAEAQGFHLAAVSGGSVTVSPTGTVTLVLASVATMPERAAGGSLSAQTAKQVPVPNKPDGVVIEESKIGYLLGRASGRDHNVQRAAENAAQMRRIGVHDTAEGRALLRAHFDEAARSPSNVTSTFSNEHGRFEIRESLFSGPGGHVKFRSTWQVLEGGVRRFTTALPFGG